MPLYNKEHHTPRAAFNNVSTEVISDSELISDPEFIFNNNLIKLNANGK